MTLVACVTAEPRNGDTFAWPALFKRVMPMVKRAFRCSCNVLRKLREERTELGFLSFFAALRVPSDSGFEGRVGRQERATSTLGWMGPYSGLGLMSGHNLFVRATDAI